MSVSPGAPSVARSSQGCDREGATHAPLGRALPHSAQGHDAYRCDRATTESAVAELRRELPAFAFVSLGDTDEHAHEGDVMRYGAALRHADDALGRLVSAMASHAKPFLVLVTTDHGRAGNFRDHGERHPESRFTWAVAYASHANVTKLHSEGALYQLSLSVGGGRTSGASPKAGLFTLGAALP